MPIAALHRCRQIAQESPIALYCVVSNAFNHQAHGNLMRFSADFMFQTNDADGAAWMLQFVTFKNGCGQYRGYVPLKTLGNNILRTRSLHPPFQHSIGLGTLPQSKLD